MVTRPGSTTGPFLFSAFDDQLRANDPCVVQTPAGIVGGVPNSALHDRLAQAVGTRSFRHVSELTRTHPETVRRYMQGQTPSVEFLAALSQSLLLNTDWLLTGRGPMFLADVKSQTLRDARASELLTAMASTIERLVDRVERLELYTQTLEARVSARTHSHLTNHRASQLPMGYTTGENTDHAATHANPRAAEHAISYPESRRDAHTEVKPNPLAEHRAENAPHAQGDPITPIEPHLQAARLVAEAAAQAVHQGTLDQHVSAEPNHIPPQLVSPKLIPPDLLQPGPANRRNKPTRP